ncbi:hypothetical protein D3C75_911640 [compost metagenome]
MQDAAGNFCAMCFRFIKFIENSFLQQQERCPENNGEDQCENRNAYQALVEARLRIFVELLRVLLAKRQQLIQRDFKLFVEKRQSGGHERAGALHIIRANRIK